MFNFSIDIEQVIKLRLRKVKRTPVALALMLSYATGIKEVFAQFSTSRDAAIKRAKVKGTKIYLEKYLDEIFGIVGIELVNLNPEAFVRISTTGSGHEPVYLNDVPGANDTFIGDLTYYANLADFEVQIPAANYAGIDQPRLRAILDEYIFSTINYKIVSK